MILSLNKEMKNIQCHLCKEYLVDQCTYLFKDKLYCIGCLLKVKEK
jgi:formylmethanofuran dehydrogenase subunit E